MEKTAQILAGPAEPATRRDGQLDEPARGGSPLCSDRYLAAVDADTGMANGRPADAACAGLLCADYGHPSDGVAQPSCRWSMMVVADGDR